MHLSAFQSFLFQVFWKLWKFCLRLRGFFIFYEFLDVVLWLVKVGVGFVVEFRFCFGYIKGGRIKFQFFIVADLWQTQGSVFLVFV